jgi:BolA protein
MTAARLNMIRTRLTQEFAPAELDVVDDSHLHAGHVGAKDGRGHFRVRIVAEQFRSVKPIQRHRMIFDALGSLMETDIHALSITAEAPLQTDKGQT